MDKTTLVIGALTIAALSFAAGRAIPRHKYVPFPNGGYMYDEMTGKACWPWPWKDAEHNVPPCEVEN
jgi:hypothetical protein